MKKIVWGQINWVIFFCSGIFFAYVAFRLSYLPQQLHNPITFPDTSAYMITASCSILDSCFWLGKRPFTVPLIYTVLGKSNTSIIYFQVLFSIFSWGILSLVIFSRLKNEVMRTLAFITVLLLSLHNEIVLWDSIILSESLSLSFTALLIASCLWLANGWKKRKVVIIIVLAVLWGFSRDSNAWILLVAAIIMACISLFRPRIWLLTTAFSLIFLASNYSSQISLRWVFPLKNIMGQRILTKGENVEYFRDHCQLPLSDNLFKLSGKWGGDFPRTSDPDGIYNWLITNGKPCYINFLLAYSTDTLKSVLPHMDTLLNGTVGHYGNRQLTNLISPTIQIIVFPSWIYIFVILAFIITAVPFIRLPKEHLQSLLVPFTTLLLVYPHLLLVYNGDAMEIERHALVASVTLRLGMWILIWIVADGILAARLRSFMSE